MSDKVVLKNQFSSSKILDFVQDVGSIKTETNYNKEQFDLPLLFPLLRATANTGALLFIKVNIFHILRA